MQYDSAEIGMKKERNINLDLIRVLSMLCVVALHTYPKPLASSVIFTTVFLNLLYTCNGNFYMLSGHLNLKGKFERKIDYQNYYAKRFISIILPFLFISCAMAVYELTTQGEGEITFLVLVKKIYYMFVSGNIKTHLWFIYPLIGMMLATPFLAKMFQAMSDWELKLLLVLALLWNTARIYLAEDWGISFSSCSWILEDWMLAFFAGYCSERVIKGDCKRKWYILGAVCFVGNIVGKMLLQDHYKYGDDLAPLYVIFNIALYSFLKNELKIRNTKVISVIRFVARHSFTLYLIHWIVSRQVTPLIVTAERATVYFCEGVAVTFGVSLFLAFLIDTVALFPMQKALKRKMVKSESLTAGDR